MAVRLNFEAFGYVSLASTGEPLGQITLVADWYVFVPYTATILYTIEELREIVDYMDLLNKGEVELHGAL